MNWIDFLVILVIFISCYVEYKSGFLVSIFKLFSFFIAIVVSWLIHPIVTAILKKSSVQNWIENSIRTTLFSEKIETAKIAVQEKEKIVDGLKIPDILKSFIVKNNDVVNDKVINNNDFISNIVDFLSNICISILAVITVFIVVMILMKFMTRTLKIVSNIPILKEINQLLGLMLGVIIGIVEVWLSFILITFLFNTNPSFNPVFVAIDNSFISKILYEHNILNCLISRVF